MQPHKINQTRRYGRILRTICFLLTRAKFRRYLLSSLLLPLIMGFSPALLEKIEITAIREMRLRHAQNQYFLDALLTIRYTGESLLKLEHCAFDLAYRSNAAEVIPLGSAQKDEILLPPQPNSTGVPIGTDVPLAVNLGANLRQLQRVFSAKEFTRLLTEPDPHFELRLQGNFDLGVKSEQGWVYKDGMKIDWAITPKIEGLLSFMAAAAPQIGIAASIKTPPAVPTIMAAVTANLPPAKTAAVEKTPTVRSNPAAPDTITVYFARYRKTLENETEEALTAKKTLEEWAQRQQNMPDGMFLHIEGHSDSSGTDLDNLKISVVRAAAVYTYLADVKNKKQFETLWAHVRHVNITGFGKTQLVMEGDKELPEKSRRVNVYLSDH